jgi:hypothetical protein
MIKFSKIHISLSRAKEIFHYDLETGFLTWKEVSKYKRRIKIGDRAGYSHHKGYRWISVDGKEYQEHRFIWFWMTGNNAPKQLDHKDGNRNNNKWDNIRLATDTQNQANKRRGKPNKNGYKGVAIKRFVNSTKYQASISDHGKPKYLGLFNTAKEAHEKYCQEARKLHGEFFYEGELIPNRRR